MRCPQCRKEMDFDAVEHSCGWKVSARIPADAVVLGVTLVADNRATAEQIAGWLAKMRETLKAPVRVEVEKPNDRKKAEVPMLKDVGHGGGCTCELCWAGRRGMPDMAGGSPGEPVPGDESRLDALRKQFPLEGGQ